MRDVTGKNVRLGISEAHRLEGQRALIGASIARLVALAEAGYA